MKKNQKTYLLLAVVLAIWGILGFRIVKTVNSAPKEHLSVEMTTEFKPLNLKKRDTFSIVANYRDPFLGTLPMLDKPKKNRKVVSQELDLPEKSISYTGFIAANGTESGIFFLTIDGQQLAMERHETQREVRLLSGDAQKVRVRYHGKTRTISRTP